MSYAVWVDPRLERKIARFPKDVIESVDEAVRALRDTPRPPRCCRIHGIPNAWRIVVRKD